MVDLSPYVRDGSNALSESRKGTPFFHQVSDFEPSLPYSRRISLRCFAVLYPYYFRVRLSIRNVRKIVSYPN